MTRKIIFVDNCALDIVMNGMTPVSAGPAGLMPEAAHRLAQAGLEVCFAGEAAADPAGDYILKSLSDAGVDTSLVDRFTGGATTLRITYSDRPDEFPRVYTRPPHERFTFGWPKAAPGDIVVFGGWFALAPRTRSEVMEFVHMCASRSMITVLLPGYEPQLQPAVTHVMPDLIESMEAADIAVTTTRDLSHLWKSDDPVRCYNRNMGFYTPVTINIDPKSGIVTTMTRDSCTEKTFNPGNGLPGAVLAGFLAALARDPREDIREITSNPPSCLPI